MTTKETTQEVTKKPIVPEMTEAKMDKITKDTGKILAAQEKVKVKLYQAPKGEKALPDETVCINGYIYQIKRGVEVEVPKSVYEVLEQAGRV